MGLTFFCLFGQTNKFKTVDVNEFAKLGTGFRGWVSAGKKTEIRR